MELTVGKLKEALGDYHAVREAVKGLPDNREILVGDIVVIPDAIAAVTYDRNWLAGVIRYAGGEGSDEEVNEVLGSCDFDDLIMYAVNESAWNAAVEACESALSREGAYEREKPLPGEL